MTKLKFAVAGAIVAAGVATPIIYQQQANAKARADVEALRQQAQTLEELRAENERLLKLKAQADELTRLRAEQDELARLRAQAAVAEEQSRQLASAKADIARLRAEQKAARNSQTNKPPATAPLPGQMIPREQWANTGYATPEAGLTTLFWAMSQGDMTASLAAISGDFKEMIQKDIGDKGEEEFRSKAAKEMGGLTAISVLDKQFVSDDEVRVKVMLAKGDENHSDTWTMKRDAEGWKLFSTKNSK